MTEKTIEGFLVFNWKDGSHRTRKSPPESTGTYEIATPFELEVEIPEIEVPEIAAKVQVPQPIVQTAVVESIDEEDFPEWSDHADKQLAAYEGAIVSAEGLAEVDELVERLTTKTLLEYEGMVDAENVRRYLESRAHRMHKDAKEQGDLEL